MELGVIHHGPNLPALCTSREGRLRWVTAASKDAVPVVEVHQIARALLTALVAGVQSLTISMPNVRTIPSQSHLIFLPLDPIGVLFPTQSIATMKVKEAGGFLKTILHLCNLLQRNASEMLHQFLPHFLFRPFDAESLSVSQGQSVPQPELFHATELQRRAETGTSKIRVLCFLPSMDNQITN